MSSLELTEEEVQVWVASLRVSDERRDELSSSLAPEERTRADTMTPSVSRKFVVARGILRSLLAGFTGMAPEKLRFEYGFNGKPSLADHNINFNISHSADLGVFAFAPDREVGIDVENERPVRRLLDVAQRFMSDEELRSLAATAPNQRDASFLRSWVVREARLKAEGKGVWSGGAAQRANITHKLFAPQAGYIAAVAAAESDWRLYTCSMKQ
ncbi:MAG: 4'-phosphopantetheinyl transferase superfamily protein [Gemmatimonadaceae bacterium]